VIAPASAIGARLPDSRLAAVTIEQDRRDLEALGFELEPPLFAVGANAGSWTAEGYLRVRREFEELPLARQGLGAVAATVEAEDRRDFRVALTDLGMEPSGVLVTPHGDLRPEAGAFQDLCGFLPARFAGAYLSSVRAELRAINVNDLLEGAENQSVVLRTRIARPGRPRGVYAVVSPSYQGYNVDRVARDLVRVLDGKGLADGARCEATYDGSLASLKVLWFNYHGTELAGCGDVFRFGARVRTADDRSSSLVVELVAHDNRCLNYLIVGSSVVKLGSKRHVGKVSMARHLEGLVDGAMSQVKGFVDRWNAASQEDVLKVLDVAGPTSEATAARVFELLLKRGYGKISGCSDAELVKRYVHAWENPGPGKARGYTRAHFIDAMTRAAHTNRWTNAWAQEELEQQASQLLYVRTLN